MNKHLYRIVFNHALGLFQVVSELVRRPGRGASKGDAPVTTATVRSVSLSLWVAFGWVALASVATAGQIVTDPNAPGNQRPTVLGSPGAAPLINITTPSKAGVSRNTYSDFNVDGAGVVLNNSRTNTTTQLAGTVAGNPWLATGTAKVILNEVTGSNPSALHGYVEVAGDRAQVIIANPAGISCDGCGVINANRFTLTTGTPVLSGGNLDGYRVTGGAVQIGANGLDATRADYTDIIARAVQVNGSIWSPQLQVTTGTNQLNAEQSQVTAIAANGEKPTLALDVSALGGMYANKIVLLGTENGVGARNAGTIGASAGDLIVTTEGRLENSGSLQSQSNTQINAAGGVTNAGTISATRELALSTQADVDNSKGTLNAARIAVDAASLRNAGGTITQSGPQGMTLDAGALSNRNGGRIGAAESAATGSTDAPSDGSASGQSGGTAGNTSTNGDNTASGGGSASITPIVPLADGILHISGLLDNDGGRISAAAGFDLASSAGLANDGGQLELRKLNLTGGNLSNQGGTLLIDGASAIHANQINNDAGKLTFASAVAMDAQSLSNRSGTLTLADSAPMTLSVAGTLDNTNGTLATNATQFALYSGTLINEHGTINHAGSDGLSLSSGDWYGAGGTVVTGGNASVTAGTMDHQGAMLSAAQLTLHAANLDNRGGVIVTGGEASNTLHINGTLDNGDKGTIETNGDLAITATTLGNASGTIQQAGTTQGGSAGTLAIQAITLNGHGGTLATNGTLALSGTTTDLRNGTTYAHTVAIDTGTLTTAGGTLQAIGDSAMVVRAGGAWDNSDGKVATNGALTVNAGVLDNTRGTLSAAGSDATQLTIAHTFTNTDGNLASMGATAVHAGALLNRGGTIQAAGAPLMITADALLDNSAHGVLTSNGDLTVTASTLDNTQGTIAHAGTGALTIAVATLNGQNGRIASNGALTLTGNTTDLRDGTTYAQSIAIDTGTLTTAGGSLQALGTDPLMLHVRNTLDNTGGTIVGNGALALDAGALSNRNGQLMAAGANASYLRVAGLFDNTRGKLGATGATTLHAGALDNTDGTIQAVTSQGGSGTDAFNVTVDGQLINERGALQTNAALDLTAGALSNHSGTIQAQQAITAHIARTLDNTAGLMVAGGNLDVQAQTLLNRDTVITGPAAAATGLYGQRVTLDTTTFDNTHGQVQARDALSLMGTSLTNAGGVLDGSGTVSLSGATLDNTGGQVIQRGDDGALLLKLSQGLTNTGGGLIGAEGTADLRTGSLDNSGGTTFARHDLRVNTDGDLLNRAGGVLQTHGALTLNAQGSLDNSGGNIDATGTAAINAKSIPNVDGHILAGSSDNADAALQITAGNTIDNRGGTIGNRGGDITLTAASIDNSSSGTLVAQRDLNLDAVGALNNADGTVVGTHNLSYQNGNATLDNSGGKLGANGTASLTLGTLTNTGGRVQADTLWLTTPILNNNGGDIGANAIHATLTTLNGLGTLHGTDLLDAHFLSDYTHVAGQQLQSDGVLALTVDGTLTNQGTLETQGSLQVTAANLINQGTINASNGDGTAKANLSAAGLIDNQTGASIAGDTLTLNATDVTNTSAQGITGDVVQINANTLTNGRDLGTADAAMTYGEGFIGASQYLDLRIGQRLANLDGDIFSGGDLSVAGRADGTRVATLDNVSGRIQADGNGSIAADLINNRRRFVETEQYALSPAEQFALNSERQYDAVYASLSAAEQQALANMGRTPPQPSGLSFADERALFAKLGWVHVDDVAAIDPALKAGLDAVYRQGAIKNWNGLDGYYIGPVAADVKQFDTYLTGTRVARESADSQILTGGTLSIDLGQHLTNVASTIAATGDLNIDGIAYNGTPDARIDNIAVAGAYTGERATTAWTREGAPATFLYKDGRWLSNPAAKESASVTQNMTFAGPVLAAATITGRNVSISGHDITNTAVQATGGIIALTDKDLSGPESTSLGTATIAQAGNTGPMQGARGNAVSNAGTVAGSGAQAVSTANSPLPSYVPPSSGKYSQNGDPSAPFLVNTAPRFAKGPVTSSDYLLRALGDDPTNIHKRLGDGYYEQNLVLDQLLQLTGRRTLNGGDGLSQYTALMDSAAAEASQLGLQLGAPLTTGQIAALSSDIVWLVDQVVNGEHVLVPVVYLSKATADRLKSDGALIAGDTVNVKASGTLRNDGTITGTQGTSLSADTLINRGAINGGQALSIATAHDTINQGTLSGHAIGILAGGSVVNGPVFDGVAARGGVISAGTGGVQIVAANDVINQGKIASQGDGVIVAGRDYVQNAAVSPGTAHAAAGSLSTAGSAAVIAGRDALFDQSTVNAGQVAYIEAGRDAHFTAATVSGGTGLAVKAGQDIISDAVTDHAVSTNYTKQGKNWSSTVTTEDTVRGSTFTSGGDATMQAGRDISLTAAIVKGDGIVGLVAERDINLGAGQNSLTETTDSFSKHVKTKTTTHSEIEDTTTVSTTISGSKGVAMSAGQDINAVAAHIASSDGAVALHADRDINLLAGQNARGETVETQTTKKGFLNKKETTVHDATYDTTAVGTTISGKEGIALDAGRNVLGIGTTLESSAGGIAVTAGDQVAFLAAANTHDTDHSEKVRRSGVEWVPNPKQGTQKKETITSTVTAVGSTLDAAGPIVVVSGGDQTYQAANITSDTGTAMISGGAINFVTATNSETYQRDSSKHNVAYQAQDHRLQVDTTEQQTSITGPVAMAAADGITIGVGQNQGETLDEAIARASQKGSGTGWIADMQGQDKVSFQNINEQHIDEHQHHEGLTQAAATVVVVAASVMTAGAASAAVGSAAGATAGSGTAFAAAGSGVAAGMGNAVVTGVIVGGVGGGVNAAVQGNDWKQGALNGAVSGGISAGLFYEAGSIAGSNRWVDGSWQKVGLHMAAGGTSSALTGGNFWNGAISAGFAEGTTPYLKDLPGGSWGQAGGAAASGAAASWLSGGDAGQGALSGLAGYLFNRQLHPEEKEQAEKLASESDGRYTAAQIEDAMRASPNAALGESTQTGFLVNVNDSAGIYDVNAPWSLQASPNGQDQFLMQQLPSNVNPGLADYITANTGGATSPYSWTNDQLGVTTAKEPYIPYLAIVPDYLSLSGNAFGIGGALALNMHTGQLYMGGSASAPLIPGGSLAAGWLPTNLGESSNASASNTRDFLTGQSSSGTLCAVLCVGANHAAGGGTSIEVGGGIKVPAKGPSISTGVMSPVISLPFTQGDKGIQQPRK
ncbi:filamentous hemagglutinin N-terminal domain-containing protein [Dyella japonica]|uniref:Filamentous haemagglutinin FhaB/tRNA nuclease CdiA-like TPS domain-containing protein n=1 Tax=Dyella japonica DSM 16301 TaxID=1440762 RepID=A0A0G9H1H4_9GAMM|nr:filamentous hemagglutinin N-terminal domain-containing protein [Dyella japonica]KLD63059.1 hypothetical protein Y882_13330 [Dyella japonica DSM 16301]